MAAVLASKSMSLCFLKKSRNLCSECLFFKEGKGRLRSGWRLGRFLLAEGDGDEAQEAGRLRNDTIFMGRRSKTRGHAKGGSQLSCGLLQTAFGFYTPSLPSVRMLVVCAVVDQKLPPVNIL